MGWLMCSQTFATSTRHTSSQRTSSSVQRETSHLPASRLRRQIEVGGVGTVRTLGVRPLLDVCFMVSVQREVEPGCPLSAKQRWPDAPTQFLSVGGQAATERVTSTCDTFLMGIHGDSGRKISVDEK